ncbi:hypothetical protein [Acinetobacter bereziniae]|uniref:hypothetical protein n=1 Tax=Acinetobacter bereziniae TaxID=106648 RepID=UPI003AF81164
MDGAPDGAEAYSLQSKTYYYSPSQFFDFDENKWVEMDRGVDLDLYESFFGLDDLRTAIAKHDTTDHVTDIRNHVSPSTLVWDLASGEDWTVEAERHG